MNRPGSPKGSWEWRLVGGHLKRNHAERLSLLTEAYGRAGSEKDGDSPPQD